MVSQQLNNLTRLITIIIFLALAGLAGSHLLGMTQPVQAAEMGPQDVSPPDFAKPQAITNSVKMVSDSLVRPGEMVTYTIMVTTASMGEVDVFVTDRLPFELDLIVDSVTTTKGLFDFPIKGEDIIVWSPKIDATTPATMSYQAILTESVVGGQIISNEAEIQETTFITTTKTATITVQQANLVMTKTVWSAHEVVQPTDPLTYTIIITNTGNETATDVLVRDELSETLLMGKSLVTTTTIAGGDSITFTIPVTVRNIPTESWTISNTAFYSYTTESGQQTVRGQKTVSVEAGKPDLSISKQVTLSKEPVEIGDTVTYQIVVTNKGIAIAENLHLVDQLPSGIDTTDELEDRITLQANQSYTMPIVGFVTNKVSEGQTLINTAYYTHDVAYDYPTKTGNASADFMVGTPGTPELTISKHVTVTQRPARPGDVVTYTITVANQGSADAIEVQIVDHLPAQLDGQSISQTMTITAGESVILPPLTATVTDSLTELITITNTVFLTHGSTTLTAIRSFTAAPVATPDLMISKSVALSNREPARPGDVVTYIITVTNQGSAEATGVQIVDNLPAQLSGESVSQTMTITAEQSVSLKITATVTQNLPTGLITISNTASLTYGSEPKSATVSFTAQKPSPIYLPLIIKQPEPENTPTPSPTPTQTPTPTPPSLPRFANPGFESGRQSWQESSAFDDLALIVPRSEFQGQVRPRNGNYAAWLGGRDNERASLSQSINIPAGFSTQYPLYLGFWYWIGSSDSCGNDEGYVTVGATRLATFDLCATNDTNGWRFRVIDVTRYAGQSITVSFSVRLNRSEESSLFLDDVYFQRDESTPASAGRMAPPVKDGPGTILTR